MAVFRKIGILTSGGDAPGMNSCVKAVVNKALSMGIEVVGVVGGYAGDLLSWVMGRMKADQAWVTIMSNINIVAVAALTDPCCIILSESVEPEENVLLRAKQQGVNILSTDKTTFAVCADLSTI